jgi:DNA-binding CsgD family transcriptional regulator
LSSARRGAGDLVFVEGAAGIGKSRLLAAACEEAEQTGMHALQARGLELERESPFGVAIELFAARLAAATPAQRKRLFAGQAAHARSLFDAEEAAPADLPALVRGLYWLTVSLAERDGPLAIVVDDAQWSDRPSMAFLAHLAIRLDGLPVTVVVSTRSGEPVTPGDALRALRDGQGAVLVEPAALSEAAVGRLVDEALPGAEPAFVAACARMSGGNPFLTRELARALHADGVPPTAASVERVEELVPASVLHSLLSRLGRLGAGPQRIAEAVAVLGDRALLRHAAVLADLDPRAAEEAADALWKAGMLAPGEPLRFAHPLIATAVRSDLAAFAQARGHRAAASLLAADGAPVREVAVHLLVSRPEADPWTSATLRDAARQAVAQGDPQTAQRMLERAVAEPPPAGERSGVLLELAGAEALLGDTAAEGRVTQALELVNGGPGRAGALRVLSRIKLAGGDHRAAAAALREVLAGADITAPQGQQILAEYLTVNLFRAPLNPEVAAHLAPLVDATRRGDPPTDPGLLAHLVLHLAFAGERPETLVALAAAATKDDPLVDAGTYGMFAGMIVQALACVDELEAAERIADRALDGARGRASVIAATNAAYHRAIPRYHAGRLADTLADLDLAQAASREGWSGGVAWAMALQAHTHLERGEPEAARAALAEAATGPDSMDEGIVLFAQARLALARRDPAAALAAAETAGASLAGDYGIDHPGFVPWRRTAALAALALGDSERAAALADDQLELARSLGGGRALGLALRTTAATAGDEAERAERLAEAAGVLESSPSRLELAHTVTELGAALRRAGRRSEAQAPLRRGLQLADEMGAAPLADAARAELRATGARPRRAAVSGVDALTPAERRVAQLAEQGLTNAQIAQDLFVTPKTVQTHLAHVYRKLDIASRRELPQISGG